MLKPFKSEDQSDFDDSAETSKQALAKIGENAARSSTGED
jgi:hypothetical protein